MTGTQASVGEASVQTGGAAPVPANVPVVQQGAQVQLPSLPVTENGTPVPLANAQVAPSWQAQAETSAPPTTNVEDGAADSAGEAANGTSTEVEQVEAKQEYV